MAEHAEYRSAGPEDLPAVARVFLAAFPESVRHYAGGPMRPRVVEDLFAICLDAEPEAFFVATVDGQVVGYVFAPSRFPGLAWLAVSRGHLLRMMWRWVSGRYGIGLRPVSIALRNGLLLLRAARRAERDARILSIAVDPACRGRHVGTGLMRAALAYLASRRVGRVRLEVRPWNAAATHLYRKLGFRSAGRTRDTQGEWVVMAKETDAGM